MAANPVLADSSYYIQSLRCGQDPLRALALAAATRDLVVCGVVRCEVGRALRSPAVLKRFQGFWDVMINVPTDHRLWEEAQRMLWTLDRQGQILSLMDVVIACCALRIDAVVLTFDSDFSRIPGLRTVDPLNL
jgi:predicted nucleic acid-binding protein